MGRRLALLTLLALAAPACAEPAPIAHDAAAHDGGVVDGGPRDAGPPDGGAPADFDGFLAHHMRNGGIQGLAAAITRDGAIERLVVAGDARAGVPVDAHTLFIVASVSKTFAAVLAMQLVEAGALDLDAPVSDVLGFEVASDEAPGVPVSARMLLAHTSGLFDDFLELADYTVNDADPTVTLDEFARAYVSTPENWSAAPLTAHSYANAGFGILGALIEAAGGESLRAQSAARIFEPLALDEPGWFLSDVDRSRLADEVSFSSASGFRVLPHHGFAFYPASSLRISVTGLARFAIMLSQGGELDGVRVLATESVDELMRVQYPELDRRQRLCFRARTLGGRAHVGHSGSTFGASAQLLLRDDGLGLVLLTNSDAYVRSRLGLDAGADALEAIMVRLEADADAR